MTIIEAFSVGCPVITTPVGGCINMVVDGYNGFISATTNDEDYYNTICRFLNMTTDEYQQMRANAFSSFAKFDISEVANNYLKVFKGQE